MDGRLLKRITIERTEGSRPRTWRSRMDTMLFPRDYDRINNTVPRGGPEHISYKNGRIRKKCSYSSVKP